MYSRRTPPEFAESLHPEAELHQAPEIPGETEPYRGREEFLRGLARWLEDWERFRYEPVEITELEDGRVLMRIRLVGQAKASGIKVERIAFNLWTFRDGKPFRCQVFWDEDQARQAAAIE